MTKISFKDYGLSRELVKTLDLLGFKTPTKVQQEVIPLALAEMDVVVKSQTGSGKTAAFGIPICEKVMWEENRPQALVITPTRELAQQVWEEIFHIGRLKRIKGVALYGKASFEAQQKALKQKTHIVVGTPGRLIDHLSRGTLAVEGIRYLVIDEADEMLRMGFVEQVEEILRQLPRERVTMLFSATLPKDIELLSEAYMHAPTRVEIETEQIVANTLTEAGYKVMEKDKLALLKDLLVLENPECCIIFCNTKQQVDVVYEQLLKAEYRCERIHGGMEQKDRLRVMEDFRKGYFRYLVATDVAARGIDITHITHVINYDLPQNKENYVHRIGRAGRAQRAGQAMSFITPEDKDYLESIEGYIQKEIPLKPRPLVTKLAEQEIRFREKMHEPIRKMETKGSSLNQEILKLHINAGKKTKMRPVDIVGALCQIEGISAEDIGIINVLDVSTFVEVLNNKGEKVLKVLQTMPIKGRVRKVTKADR